MTESAGVDAARQGTPATVRPSPAGGSAGASATKPTSPPSAAAGVPNGTGTQLALSPVDVILLHRLAERGLSVSALARSTRIPQSNLSEMLSGKRDWSKSAIQALSTLLNIRPDRFFPTQPLPRKPAQQTATDRAA